MLRHPLLLCYFAPEPQLQQEATPKVWMVAVWANLWEHPTNLPDTAGFVFTLKSWKMPNHTNTRGHQIDKKVVKK